MTWKSAVLGFGVSLILGHFILWLIMDKILWPYLTKKANAKKDPAALSAFLGLVERMLYTASFVIGKPEFIALWLGLKTVVQWRGWKEDQTRGTYNAFLIGSGLNVIISYVGAAIVAQAVLTFTQ